MFNARQLRTYHRRLSLIFSLPMLVIILSGVALSVRNHFEFLSPKAPEKKSLTWNEGVSPQKIAESLQGNPHHQEIQKNIDSLILKPKIGVYLLRTRDGREAVFDARTGEFLALQNRRTLWIHQFHEGTFWKGVNLRDWIYVPTGVGLIILWLTGMAIGLKSNFKSKKK